MGAYVEWLHVLTWASTTSPGTSLFFITRSVVWWRFTGESKIRLPKGVLLDERETIPRWFNPFNQYNDIMKFYWLFGGIFKALAHRHWCAFFYKAD